LVRRRKQAARRRSTDIEGYREAERVRQQQWREQRARAQPGCTAPPRHAPSTDGKRQESLRKIREFVDNELRLSRAELARRHARIRRNLARQVDNRGAWSRAE
jgi:hypothetical protein